MELAAVACLHEQPLGILPTTLSSCSSMDGIAAAADLHEQPHGILPTTSCSMVPLALEGDTLPRIASSTMGTEKAEHLVQLCPLPSDFVEMFAGKALLTNAVRACSLIASAPWDICIDDCFDVLRSGEVVLSALRKGYVKAIHFATPCQSFSKARSPPPLEVLIILRVSRVYQIVSNKSLIWAMPWRHGQ